MYLSNSDSLLEILKSESWYDPPENYAYHDSSSDATVISRTSDYTILSRDGKEAYQCICGRVYKLKGSLSDHKKWECGKPPSFQCPYCDYCGKHKKHLRRHVLTVHKVPFTIEQATMSRIQTTNNEYSTTKARNHRQIQF